MVEGNEVQVDNKRLVTEYSRVSR